ncbi:MAG: glycosyltransferase [Actinomycetaceae bacterium]|nr:glycosyltransferase [Arcanobacterium sp.]MDD7505172.1 glycosyltransferase [Actinomycetaceae bacterium]
MSAKSHAEQAAKTTGHTESVQSLPAAGLSTPEPSTLGTTPGMNDDVVAVVVTQRGDAHYAPVTLRAIHDQTRPPDRVEFIIISDDAARQSSPQSPASQLGATQAHPEAHHDSRFPDPVPEAFENAVNTARGLFGERLRITKLSHASTFFDAIRQLHALHGSPREHWLWLLHADSAPEPRALAELIRISERSDKIGIVAPKQVAWNQLEVSSGADPSTANELLEVGIHASRSGRRLPETIPGERDQGQLDARLDMLAVGSAGMLIGAHALQDAGGLSAGLGPFGDGLELSRRIRLAGYRVVVAPQAILRHAQLSLGEPASTSFARRRTAQIVNSLLTVQSLLLPFAWLGYVLLGVVRAFARAVTRDVAFILPELSASIGVFISLSRILKMRKLYRRLQATQSSLAALETSPSEIRAKKRFNRRIITDAEQLANRPDPLVMRAWQDLARHTRRGIFAVLLISIVFAIAVYVPVISHGVLTGGAIGIERITAVQLWEYATHEWLARGSGSLGAIDALWLFYLPLLAVGYPFGLTLGMLFTATLYLALPLAALAAYLMNGRFTLAWHARVMVALIWMLSPPFLEALQQGRIAPAVMHIMMPVLVWAWVGAWRGNTSELALASLVLAILSATLPMWMIFALALALIALIAAPHARLAWVWLPVPSLVVMLPQLLELKWSEALAFLFAHPGVPLSDTASVRDVLRGFATRSLGGNLLDSALIVAVAIIVGAALAAIVRGVRTTQIRIGIVLLAFGMALAIGSRYVTVGYQLTSNGMEPVIAWHGAGAAIAWMGVCIAIANGSYSLRTSLRRYRFGARQILAAAVLLVLPASVLTMIGQWANVGISNQDRLLHDEPAMVVPALAQTEQDSPARSRVLVLEARNTAHSAVQPGSVMYSARIWRTEGTSVLDYPLVREVNSLAAGADATDLLTSEMNTAVANLIAGAPQASEVLGRHAISVVLVPPVTHTRDSAGSASLVAALQSNAGLDFVAQNEAGSFWRVARYDSDTGWGASQTARVQVVSQSGGVQPVDSGTYAARVELASAQDNRVLSLAERDDPRWRATLDGVELSRADNESSMPQWLIPAGAAGTLHVWYSQPWFVTIRIVQAVVAVVGLIGSIPTRPVRGYRRGME